MMSSYLVRFSIDIFFSSLVSFAFFCLLVVFFFLKLKIFTLIYIRLYGRVSDKKKFHPAISVNKTTFYFGLSVFDDMSFTVKLVIYNDIIRQTFLGSSIISRSLQNKFYIGSSINFLLE